MQKNAGRIIRNKTTLQTYIGTTNEAWQITMRIWQEDTDKPMPLPVGHVHFGDTVNFEDVN